MGEIQFGPFRAGNCFGLLDDVVQSFAILSKSLFGCGLWTSIQAYDMMMQNALAYRNLR
jgi:hypothetical protein